MASTRHPNVIVLAGPNGSGKSTTAPSLLKGTLGVTEFVNADVIAQGLSGFDPLGSAMEASRIMLLRLHDLAKQRASFAFETTLASRSLAPWLKELVAQGYRFRLVFLWLPDADAAVARVAARVRLGGHFVPQEIIRRRYEAGLKNFFRLYQPLAATWRIYDNSQTPPPRLIAAGAGTRTARIADRPTWLRIQGAYA